ncbi:MAG: hypothetical protein IJU23_12550 [Proteobacteria bacterium]|nr:hypothetical protein [Pseudomonadota bacterium]
MKKSFLFLLAIAASSSGCVLGEAASMGELCPSDPEISEGIGYIMHPSCTAESCDIGDFSTNFERGICPEEYPYCSNDGDEYFCSKHACKLDQHIFEDECEDNSVYHCGSHKNNCTISAGWAEGRCVEGVCIVDKCTDEYILNENRVCEKALNGCHNDQHLYNQKCEDDSLEHCGNHEVSCHTIDGWEKGACIEGKCIAEFCKEYYTLTDGKCVFGCSEDQHEVNNTCEDNTLENCGTAQINCMAIEGWEDGTCEKGECILKSCQEFYHIEDNQCLFECSENQHEVNKVCEDNTLENCGTHGNNCIDLDGWATGACMNGTCVPETCSEGFHIYMNRCEKDDSSNCGSHNTKCIVNDGSAFCENGSCKISCDTGFHEYNGDCEPNTLENCGAHGSKCTVSNGNPRCTAAGDCVVDNCKTGFHSYNNDCEPDSTSHCGGHDIKCNVANGKTSCVNGACHLDSCNTNYHKFNNSCEADTVDNCGAHGTKCTIANGTPKCENALCGLKSCNTNYHPYNGACEVNSITNCGSHDKKCTIANGTPKCENGNCGLQGCNTNYHIYNGGCEVNSTSNCGAHGTVCSYPNGVATCANGQCKLDKCNSNAHSYNGGCELDSTSNCGSHGAACKANASCVNKKCICNTNYHDYNGTCELNDSYHCGAHDNKCPNYSGCNTTTGQCVCQAGKHMYNGKCESDTTTNCGSHGNACPAVEHGTKKCIEGKCTFVCNSTDTCGSSAYHRYEYTCEKNDVTNCGAHGAACTTSTVPNSKAVSCTKRSYCGQCRATSCLTGYKLQDGTCVPK